MQRYPRGPRPSSYRFRSSPSQTKNVLRAMLGSWRVLLLVGALLAALAATIIPRATAGNSASQPMADPKSAVPGVGTSARGGSALAAPAPTPTPCCIRPLAGPTATLENHPELAPARKPNTPDPAPSTQHVVVLDGASGEILFQRNAFEPIPPASLTKIMTAILGIERGNPSEHIKVDVSASSFKDSTLMGLEPWFDVTLEDVLYGLMLPSGNDAAVAIARHIAGSEEVFVQLMNQRAAELGLHNTHFANPHGLDQPDHYSSPYDMAVLARYGMQYPLFRKLAAARTYNISRSNIAYTIENLNPMLWAYPGADGVKIGYTDSAGSSIVATAVRDGHRIYVAFMRSKAGLVPDATELFDWAFNSFIWP